MPFQLFSKIDDDLRYAPRDISSSDKLLPSELLYQVLVLSGYSPLAYQLIATRPSWSWIFPKDGMTLSMVLATLYTEKVRIFSCLCSSPTDGSSRGPLKCMTISRAIDITRSLCQGP